MSRLEDEEIDEAPRDSVRRILLRVMSGPVPLWMLRFREMLFMTRAVKERELHRTQGSGELNLVSNMSCGIRPNSSPCSVRCRGNCRPTSRVSM